MNRMFHPHNFSDLCMAMKTMAITEIGGITGVVVSISTGYPNAGWKVKIRTEEIPEAQAEDIDVSFYE